LAINAGARITSLQQNHCDMVVAAFSYTPARAKLVSFTRRYLKTDKVIVSNTNITRKQPVIALVRGTTNSAKGLKGKIAYFNNYNEIIFAMEAGSIDYVVADRPIALHMIRSVTKSYKVIKALSQQEIYAIGVNKNNKGLLHAINFALQELANSGRLAYLHRQWL
jgi:polar amino acid transport system substrate-binding protein